MEETKWYELRATICFPEGNAHHQGARLAIDLYQLLQEHGLEVEDAVLSMLVGKE